MCHTCAARGARGACGARGAELLLRPLWRSTIHWWQSCGRVPRFTGRSPVSNWVIVNVPNSHFNAFETISENWWATYFFQYQAVKPDKYNAKVRVCNRHMRCSQSYWRSHSTLRIEERFNASWNHMKPWLHRSSGLWRFAFKQSWQRCVDSHESTKGGTGEQIKDSHSHGHIGSLLSVHARRCSTPCSQSEKKPDTITAGNGGRVQVPHLPVPTCSNDFRCETSVTRRIQHCASAKGNTCWNRTRTRQLSSIWGA